MERKRFFTKRLEVLNEALLNQDASSKIILPKTGYICKSQSFVTIGNYIHNAFGQIDVSTADRAFCETGIMSHIAERLAGTNGVKSHPSEFDIEISIVSHSVSSHTPRAYRTYQDTETITPSYLVTVREENNAYVVSIHEVMLEDAFPIMMERKYIMSRIEELDEIQAMVKQSAPKLTTADCAKKMRTCLGNMNYSLEDKFYILTEQLANILPYYGVGTKGIYGVWTEVMDLEELRLSHFILHPDESTHHIDKVIKIPKDGDLVKSDCYYIDVKLARVDGIIYMTLDQPNNELHPTPVSKDNVHII